MRPNFHPEGKTFGESKIKASSNSKPITQLWHKNGRCSEGTIPIRRTKKDDILRASSVQKFGKKNQRSIPQPKPAKPLPDIITQSGHQVLPLSWYSCLLKWNYSNFMSLLLVTKKVFSFLIGFNFFLIPINFIYFSSFKKNYQLLISTLCKMGVTVHF